MNLLYEHSQFSWSDSLTFCIPQSANINLEIHSFLSDRIRYIEKVSKDRYCTFVDNIESVDKLPSIKA